MEFQVESDSDSDSQFDLDVDCEGDRDVNCCDKDYVGVRSKTYSESTRPSVVSTHETNGKRQRVGLSPPIERIALDPTSPNKFISQGGKNESLFSSIDVCELLHTHNSFLTIHTSFKLSNRLY